MAGSQVVDIKIEDEIKKSYLDYALSVIIGRAIPDLRDGLKPVQRRIIYAMYDMGNTWNRPYKKSARIVGDVIGKYHPHGDAAVYDSIVRMAQDFNMRYPLIDGQGNFGSVDGDPPAAMRYTEVRLHKIANELLRDIDKETVKFTPNYDSSLMEPEVLPSRLPNLLVNGSSGIAVGMATNIPPHNICEVIDGLLMLLDNEDLKDRDLLKVIKGPDFPTGGILIGSEDLRQAYLTGKGIVKIRAKTYIEIRKGGKANIIIQELPYQVNKSRLIEKISELARNKLLEGIEEIRDETDREGTRIVLEIRKKDLAEVVLNKLFKHTQLETNFGIIFLAIDDGMPKVLKLKDILTKFLQFRREIILNRTRYELQKAKEECHVLEGLKIALDKIDLILSIIRGSHDPKSAKERLTTEISLTDRQAQAILEMRLQRLTRMEKDKLIQDYKELRKRIREYEEILKEESKVRDIIRSELLEIKDQYGDERKTDILDHVEDINYEDLIFEENMVITLTHRGYMKRTPLSLFRTQRRGGKGISGISVSERDYVEHLFVASTHTYILIFTDIGKVYWLKVHQIPEAGRSAKGRPIVNLLPLQGGENVTTVLPVRDFSQEAYIVMATKKGYVKKTHLGAFSHPRSTGIIAINLEEDDSLMAAVLTNEGDMLFFASREGMCLMISSEEVREMGRTARGVRGIRLRGDDSLISMINVQNDDTILSITDKGYGKRTPVDRYRLQRRGGIGVINMKLNERNGKMVRAFQVSDNDEIILMTTKGTMIRIPASEIKVVGRNAMGVKLMNVNEDEWVVSAQKVMDIE